MRGINALKIESSFIGKKNRPTSIRMIVNYLYRSWVTGYFFVCFTDDDFFKLEEMNQFLIDQERPVGKKTKKADDESDSEESVNLFDDESEHDSLEDTEGNPKYRDFFENEKENVTMREKESDEDDDCEKDQEDMQEKSNSKSSHEMRAERLRKRIEGIEGEKLNPKPWQMKGEVTGEGRPENSLLEEVVEFDLINRPG